MYDFRKYIFFKNNTGTEGIRYLYTMVVKRVPWYYNATCLQLLVLCFCYINKSMWTCK